mgnify:CR=1 FL=1
MSSAFLSVTPTSWLKKTAFFLFRHFIHLVTGSKITDPTTGLQGLGWSAKDAELAVENVADLVTADPQISLGRLMKAALQSLARA